MELEFRLDLPRQDVALGVVLARGVSAGPAPAALAEALDRCIEQRQGELPPELEVRRSACREMLRNGRYKPTGRGKPASEYLLRAAGEGAFPRINGPVDANNLVSLEHLLPISLWDVELAALGGQGERITFRLGRPGESYVFNSSGQELALEDLVCGAACDGARPDGVPIVNPIKDCLRTKTTADSSRVAAVIYCPLAVLSPEGLDAICAELEGWLGSCADAVSTARGVVLPHSTLHLSVA